MHQWCNVCFCFCFHIDFFFLPSFFFFFFQWNQFIQNPSRPEMLPRLPMTKAGVRAMDAVTEFWQGETGEVLNKWIVAGASKRGWTAW